MTQGITSPKILSSWLGRVDPRIYPWLTFLFLIVCFTYPSSWRISLGALGLLGLGIFFFVSGRPYQGLLAIVLLLVGVFLFKYFWDTNSYYMWTLDFVAGLLLIFCALGVWAPFRYIFLIEGLCWYLIPFLGKLSFALVFRLGRLISPIVSIPKDFKYHQQHLRARGVSSIRTPIRWIRLVGYGFLVSRQRKIAIQKINCLVRGFMFRDRSVRDGRFANNSSIQPVFAVQLTLFAIFSTLVVILPKLF